MPTVSVVIPSYNCAAYVLAAIDSVLQQSYKDTEVIVVDDGSTDGTQAVVASRQASGRLRYVYQHNRGLPGARNTGVRLCAGKYVAALDADDILAPNALELMVHALERSGKAWCITDLTRFSESHCETRRTQFPADCLLLGILRDDFICRAMFFRRDSLCEAGMWDEAMKNREDWDLNIRLIHKGIPFEYVDQPLYHYRARRDGISKGSIATMLTYTQALLHKHHRVLADSGSAAVARIYSDNMWALGRRYLYEEHDWRAALRCARESLKYGSRYARAARALLSLPGRIMSRPTTASF